MAATLAKPNKVSGPRDIRREKASEVVRRIEEICDEIGQGGRLPTHRDLMRRLGASERMTLGALEHLERSGRIERRYGSGTYVAEPGARKADVSGRAPAVTSNSIVVLAKPDYAYFDRCVRLLFEQAESAGLNVVFRPVSEERLPHADEFAAGAAGFIVFGAALRPLAHKLHDAGHRMVSVATPTEGMEIELPTVHGDQARGGYLLMKHLIDLGHRRIALTFGEGPRSLREKGHDRAVAEVKRLGKAVDVIGGSQNDILRLEAGVDSVRAYLDERHHPTAILAWNDEGASRVVGALSRAGISVPGQISVTGYDASPEGERLHPSLTTVEPYIGDQLRAAVDLLSNPEPPAAHTSVVIVPQLIVRESTVRPVSAGAIV